MDLGVWARALYTVSTATGPAAKSAATKILSRLVERGLIERRHGGKGRKVTVTLLAADGKGAPYVRPNGKTIEGRFLKLNHAFWLEEWDQQLKLSEIAMLLVALHEKPDFTLPTERMPSWYGWSADTAERGFRGLAEHGLLEIRKQTVTDALSPSGLTESNRYSLLAPFDAASINVATTKLTRGRT